MNKHLHEGYLLRQYIEKERGRLSEVTDALNLPRTSLYRVYGEATLSDAVKKKLVAKGIKIDGVTAPLGIEKFHQSGEENSESEELSLLREKLFKRLEEHVELLQEKVRRKDEEILKLQVENRTLTAKLSKRAN